MIECNVCDMPKDNCVCRHLEEMWDTYSVTNMEELDLCDYLSERDKEEAIMENSYED